jgi:hypothetical protein
MATIRDGRIIVSCSWCHSSARLFPGPAWCLTCGHRADVARVDCDCPKCWKPDDVEADGGLPRPA